MSFDLLAHIETSRQMEEELERYEIWAEMGQLHPQEQVFRSLADKSLQKTSHLREKISKKMLDLNSTTP